MNKETKCTCSARCGSNFEILPEKSQNKIIDVVYREKMSESMHRRKNFPFTKIRIYKSLIQLQDEENCEFIGFIEISELYVLEDGIKQIAVFGYDDPGNLSRIKDIFQKIKKLAKIES